MFENIIIVLSVILIVWGCIFSWRLDNVSTKKNEKEEKIENRSLEDE